MLSLHYHELMGNIKEYEGKEIDSWRLCARYSIRQD